LRFVATDSVADNRIALHPDFSLTARWRYRTLSLKREDKMLKVSFPSFDTVKSWINPGISTAKRIMQFFQGPEIATKLLAVVDVRDSHFYPLEVQNVGGGTAVSRVFLKEVTGGKDRHMGVVTSQVELAESNTQEPTRLFGTARATYSILIVNWQDPTGPSLFVVTKENKWFPLTVPPGPLPLAKHHEIRLVFRVVFYMADDPVREKTDKELTFSIKPNPAQNRFEVTLLKTRQLAHAHTNHS
jgi:hypothetical protein